MGEKGRAEILPLAAVLYKDLVQWNGGTAFLCSVAQQASWCSVARWVFALCWVWRAMCGHATLFEVTIQGAPWRCAPGTQPQVTIPPLLDGELYDDAQRRVFFIKQPLIATATIAILHNINSSGAMAVHLFLFSLNLNSYVCFYVGLVCTVLLT